MEFDKEDSPSGSLSAHDVQKTKKRRLHGACDGCRKKKIKCDSAETLGNKCSNCQASKIECTHDMPRQPKKSETQAAYIHSLEQKVEKMQRLLQTVYPQQDLDLLLDMSADELAQSSPILSPATTAISLSSSDIKYPISSISKDPGAMVSTPADSDDDDAAEADDFAHIALAEHLSHLSFEAFDNRFFGRSSNFMFVKDAALVRSQLTGIPPKSDASKFRRPIYWDIRQWEKEYAVKPEPFQYVYPDEDLLRSLVFIYFEKFNPLFPVLHRPTFLKMLLAGRHHYDSDYGMTVLLVCALASRYSHDPRVLMPGDTSWLSAGWKYFCQVSIHRNNLLEKSTIFDLQYFALAVLYLIGTSIPQAGWNVLGLGMRYLLEKGIHRRSPQSQKPSADEELGKRAFWCMFLIDRIMSSFLGRPCIMQDEDFDVDYPIECDDEYWETPNPDDGFKQPSGKPCEISAFVWHVKLFEVLGFALRTLYSTKKSKLLSGMVGAEWEQRIVAELDSSMNKWKDSMPSHLVWDPERQNPVFFHQSVTILATYYYVQIQIHRPFLTKKSPLSLPSLAICTNAARSCARVLEVALTRGIRVMPNVPMAAFSAGIVIALNLWGIRHSGLLGDPVKEKANLQRCLNVLRECEKRWHVAGRACDLLNEVASLDEYQPTAVPKRRREGDGLSASVQQSATYTQSPFSMNVLAQSNTSPLPTLHSVPNSAPSPPIIPPPPVYNTAAVNDWDLGSLLLLQMGYGQPNAGNHGFDHQALPSYLPGTNSSQIAEKVLDAPSPNPVYGQSASASPEGMNTDDLFSLWSDIPVAFSVEEWDAYLANMSKS